MSEKIGFNAYIFYIRTKLFFNSKSYDILNHKINKERYIDKWNKVRAKKDGHYFQKIENYLPHQRLKYIQFFSSYYLKNPDFYVKEIVDDRFSHYKYHQYQMLHVKEGLKTDFKFILNFADKNKRPFKDIFRSKNLPPAFKLFDQGKISIYSLIIFNEIFHLIEEVKHNKLNFLDKERYTFYTEKIFNKFRFVVNDILFNENDWVNILKGV